MCPNFTKKIRNGLHYIEYGISYLMSFHASLLNLLYFTLLLLSSLPSSESKSAAFKMVTNSKTSVNEL